MASIGRRMAMRYGSLAAAMVAAAVFVVALPSVPAPRQSLVTGPLGVPSGDATASSATAGSGVSGRGAGDPASASGGKGATAGDGGGVVGAASGSRPATCFRKEVALEANCPPSWSGGDNRGDTYRGVTGKEIRIVFYAPKRNEQVQAILAQTGTLTDAENASQLKAFEKYFNEAYQTFGRRFRFIYQVGPGSGSDTAQMQADAQMVANELKAFAVISTSTNPVFHVELARLGVPSVTGLNQYAASAYEEFAPYFYGLLPDLDLTLSHVAEYYCKRLNGRDVAYDDDPALSGPRKLGIVYPPVFNNAGPVLKKMVEACGGTVARVVEYNPDISRLAQEATNVVVQLKQAGATTVTCVCDVLSPIFITNQASSQAYFPEWLQNGFWATDSIGAARLYDQKQWRNSFGPSVLPYQTPVAENPPYRAYFWAKPNGSKREASRSGLTFGMLSVLAAGVENAGPVLNPQTLRAGLFASPVRLDPPVPDQQTSFGPNGPSPYTAVDDTVEIWYDPDTPGPDGDQGRLFYVAGGRRFVLGEWPGSNPKVFVDDGSPQPRPDPNYE